MSVLLFAGLRMYKIIGSAYSAIFSSCLYLLIAASNNFGHLNPNLSKQCLRFDRKQRVCYKRIMSTTFYIVRHGQTLFNKKKLFQGWCDSPLLETGIRQAKSLHHGLLDIPFEKAVSSTSERAVDTMHYILKDRDIPMSFEKGLREISFGDLEGSYYPDARPSKEQDWLGYAYCRGENRDEARERFMNTLKKVAIHGNVLIVSHGAVILRTLQKIDQHYSKMRQSPAVLIPNCSVTIIHYIDGDFRLKKKPDVSYRDLHLELFESASNDEVI